MDEPRAEKDLEALGYVSSVVRSALADDDPCRFVFRADIYRYDFVKEKLGDKIDLFNVSAGIDLSRAGWEKTWKQTTGCYDVASLQEHQQRGSQYQPEAIDGIEHLGKGDTRTQVHLRHGQAPGERPGQHGDAIDGSDDQSQQSMQGAFESEQADDLTPRHAEGHEHSDLLSPAPDG